MPMTRQTLTDDGSVQHVQGGEKARLGDLDLTQTAFDEAHRAVGELLQMRHGWFPRI